MGKIFSISNQKGGTSKSSSAVNLGAALKMKGNYKSQIETSWNTPHNG